MNKAAQQLGRLGGLAKSAAKAAAVRENGKLGGRPKKPKRIARRRNEALIGLRLKGTRKQLVVQLSDVYRVAALWYGQKEAAAKREARKNGVSWRTARKAFIAKNSIPV